MATPNVGDSLPGTGGKTEQELIAEARALYGDKAVNELLTTGVSHSMVKRDGNRASMRLDFAKGMLGSGAEEETPPAPIVPSPPLYPQGSAYDPKVVSAAKRVGNFFTGDPAAATAIDREEQVREEAERRGILAGQEAEGIAQAGRERGSVPVEGASPEQQRAAVMAALQGLKPRVVGMTKGGFQPAGRGEQVQVESKEPGPEWREALRNFTEKGRAAAEGESAVATELQLLAQAGARARAAALQTQAQAEEQALASESRAREFAEQRIQRAIADFEASAPRAENYGTLFENATPGEKVGGVVGALFGIFGSALTGKPSRFTEQLDNQIERRARAAEQAAQVKGQAVQMLDNAYARLERSFADSRASRAALRAIYTEQAKAELEAAAARIGVGAEHPRLQAALAALEEKRLGYLKETAAVVTQNARSEEKYVPPQAIVQPGGLSGIEDLLGKDDKELLQKYESELEKRGILQAEQGISTMNEGIEQLKKEGAGRLNGIMLRLAATNPDRWGELSGQFGSPGLQTFLTGLTRFRTSDTGKATTTNELRDSANALGKGDPDSLARAMYNFNRRVSEGKRSLQGAGYGRASQVYELLREHYRSLGRGGQDFKNVPTPTPQTEGLPLAK